MSADGADDDEPSADKARAESAKSSPAADTEDEKEDEEEDAGAELPLPPPVVPAPQATLPVSHLLDLLIRRIVGFERLVRRKDYRRAAIVADDVLKAFESFDPRLYLPAVLTPYFTTLASSSAELEPILKQRDSLAFTALRQLYQVAPKSFGGGTSLPAHAARHNLRDDLEPEAEQEHDDDTGDEDES